MPTIYDNIEQSLLDGLKDALHVAKRGDFCVGYFNLRGWRSIATEIDNISAEADAPACRLIVGMANNTEKLVQTSYNDAEIEATNKIIHERKQEFARSLMQQLTYGIPTAQDEKGLQQLVAQLRNGRLQVKFFGAHPLHAKLYLAHRDDTINPIIGYLGSSNLTLSGLVKQGELNVDVLDKDAAGKLARWFEARWGNSWCLDITDELVKIIEESWAGGPIKPYEIYIKTAYELSKEAIEGSRGFKVPKEFDNVMLEFQKQAVTLAAERLSHHRGVILGDVVGLGKTLVASAVAKTFQEDRADNVLVICPPKLEEMWKDYLHQYNIAGETLSLGQVSKLEKMRRYRFVVIDESHNLRNRTTKRYAQVRQYIRANESRVMLLTATPYNKDFTDIGNQLRLFKEADADLGVRPDDYIQSLGGIDQFRQKHTNTLATSLAAFEHSAAIDDWREIMRMYMVRRTRSHIKANYAEYDEERKQHYLTFEDDSKFYFPHRVPKCAMFSFTETGDKDQYARLYSAQVVDIVNALSLPRYGIAQYLLPEYQQDPLPAEVSANDQRIIKNLSQGGSRLIGFARSGLFKRLESSGPAFLLSVKRHIVRNAIYLAALEQKNGQFPIGDIFVSLADETVEEDEPDTFSGAWHQENQMAQFLEAGKNQYQMLSSPAWWSKFDWVKTDLFNQSLQEHMLNDCQALLQVLDLVPQWDADTDRKLAALTELCLETHATEKLLIFTQFKDTADYLHQELAKRGVDRLGKAFGGMDNIVDCIKRFSPVSNGQQAGMQNELRVLISTDTLSEGQNLQDAHIVVNFDLPWAIIRLVQRAGRVDRIGQQANEILCYCFLPADGIESIIKLRSRLQARINQSAELIGSDEAFFEGDVLNLQHIYEGSISLEEHEDETDLISRAYDIWRQATKDNPALQKKIEGLPAVVYSAKHSDRERGAVAYIKTSNRQHILAQINEAAQVVSQSQFRILDLLACKPEEPTAKPSANHHDLVAAAVKHVKTEQKSIGGQLGGTSNIRYRLYNRLQNHLQQNEGTLFHSEKLKRAVNQIYHHPLQETARDRLSRQLRAQISDEDLAQLVQHLYNEDSLCVIPKEGDSIQPQIICSMGLVV